jgi:dTDP-4-dehydrorhamnose reductase
MSENILIFGAYGLLGTSLSQKLENMGYQVLRQSRSKEAAIVCDPTNIESVRSTILQFQPTVIVNSIALSNVDFCESNLTKAYLANIKTVEVLASVIDEIEKKPHLIQISTDHLYSGQGPHSENNVRPLNVYALTKFAGDLIALQVGATILRTNFFGLSNTPNRTSFTDWLFKSLHSEEEFLVFDDVLFNPIHMNTLAYCINRVIKSKSRGVFNVGSRSGISKATFAKIFAESLNLDTTKMKVGCLSEVTLNAQRPFDMRMNISAFESEFEMEMPDIKKEIHVASNEYRNHLC